MDSELRLAAKEYRDNADLKSAVRYWSAFCRSNPGYSLFIPKIDYRIIISKLKTLKLKADHDYRMSHRKELLDRFIKKLHQFYNGRDIVINNWHIFNWNSEQNKHDYITERRGWQNEALSLDEKKRLFKEYHAKHKNAEKIDSNENFTWIDFWIIWNSDSFRRILEFWESKKEDYVFQPLWEN